MGEPTGLGGAVTRVAILTDSTADLPPALQAQHGITVVPLNVHFGTEVLLDQVEIGTDEFMARLGRAPKMPTTSQPAVGVFEAAFRRLAPDHDAIVAVLISSKLSGTLQSATLAADLVRDTIPVEIVDSLNGSMGLGFQVLRAADLAAQGVVASEIARRLRSETEAYHTVFFVDTLEFLQRGGRIGRASALLGGLLNLKPLLRVDEGQVVPFERTRTRARAIQGLVDFVQGLPNVGRISALYATSAADGADLAGRLAVATGVPTDAVVVAQLGPVIGVHIGPGAMGVAVFEGAEA